MMNQTKDIMDTASIQKSIEEREKMINWFKAFGTLDRDDAIHKILELRNTDQDVLTVTAGTMMAGGSTPFSDCPNAQLVNELQMQANILKAKLIKKTAESLSKED